MIPTLRPHQQADLESLREELRTHRAVLLVAPCGYGKGTIITVIVHRATERGKKTIFAVHGKALVHDMSERVRKLGIPHGVLMGNHTRERWHPVQVCSIDTLHRMPHPPAADLIICDEAHMCMSPTWRKTLDRFPAAKIIGMTATPIRLDKQGLGIQTGGIFDSMVVGPCEQELIDLGFLVRSRVLAPPAPAGVDKVGKTAGDFNTKQLATVCDKVKLVGDIVTHWHRHASGRKTAAFGVDQAHARHITEQFVASGVRWAYVDADTPDLERAAIWKDLDSGTLMGVSSVGCIAVGWDHPVVSCLIAARPTASLGWWRQMLGRGSRVHPGKEDFLVLDHAGNTHRHEPYGMFEDRIDWCLDGDAIKATAEKKTAVATCKTPVRIDGVLKLPCYATFKAGPRECPYCGLPLAKAVREVQMQDGELQEIPLVARKPVDDAKRHNEYLHLVTTGIERGYKAGWATIKFKATHGYWPRREWVAEGRSMQERQAVSA